MRSMPTINPRITITLTPEAHAVLREVSAATEQSQSAIVGELVQMSLPVFQRVAAAVKAARAVEATAKGEIVASLERAQHRLEGQMRLQLHDMDEAFRPLLEHAEKVHRRSSSPGGAGAGEGEVRPRSVRAAPSPAPAEPGRGKGSTPRPVTRGVGSPPAGSGRGKGKGRRGGL